jgi:hypothetical protein
MAGRDTSQKRKKHIKSLVLVPDDAGIEFAEKPSAHGGAHFSHNQDARMLFTLGHIDRNITFMQSPPILAWTPYQILRGAVSGPGS